RARLNRQYCDIPTPLTGAAGKLLVNTGNLVSAYWSQPLIQIAQIQPIYVTFSLPERYFWDIQKYRAKNDLEVEAQFPNTTEAPEKGVLTFVDNKVHPDTGMLNLRATFPNPDKRLWPGQFVEAVLTERIEANAVVVPARALASGPDGDFVYVVKEERTVEV